MILNDKQIKKLAEEGMIKPFIDKSVSNGISMGLQSYGYDICVGSEFKIFTNIKGNVVADPKNFSEDNFVTVKNEESILIPPNSFALCHSRESFKMPRNVTGLVTLKSTYCRVGLGHPPSVLEAGWCGVLVLELVNHSSNPVRVYSNTGISQILFFRGEEAAVSYADKKGKYQNQGEEGKEKITFAKAK
tara:strand:+ start:124 stop:690 length:567 start_codon:yes stop_codon:yes gene_type:complete